MKTGEGKTLVATFPAYLNALDGKGVHIVTVNDYLVRRDAEWMGKVFVALGLTTGAVYPQQPERESAGLRADVTYATNNELGFDYLRDNMKSELKDMIQRFHNFAIVDEVDSILIDEARTPLIISGPARGPLRALHHHRQGDPRSDGGTLQLDEKTRNVTFTDEGNEFLEGHCSGPESCRKGRRSMIPKARPSCITSIRVCAPTSCSRKDKDYIVRDGEGCLIDEFTGRMMTGRRFPTGCIRRLRPRKTCDSDRKTSTLAIVTFQNYFRLYDKLAGMTGTAQTEAEEFRKSMAGCGRDSDQPGWSHGSSDDAVYRTAAEKYDAIIEECKKAHENGQPVLVGTTSIEKSEESADAEEGSHPQCSERARSTNRKRRSLPMRASSGAVTIATNMAGRGTDIQLAATSR